VVRLLKEAVARLKLSRVEQLVLADEITDRAVGRLPWPLLEFSFDVVDVCANGRRAAALHAHNEIRAAALASNHGPPTTLFAVDNGSPRIKAAGADIATERHGTERGLHHGTTPAGCEGGVTGGVSGRIDVVPVALGDRNRQQAQHEQRRHITPVYARGAASDFLPS